MKFTWVVPFIAGLFPLVSVASQGAAYEGERREVRLERSQKDLRPAQVIETDVTAPIFRVSTRWEWQSQAVIQPVCSSMPGDGRGDWKGFFTASRTEKAARLAEAIKGIGLNTAQKLVADNVFSHKPRTWDEFRAVIITADRVYRTGFSQQVLVKYGRENAENLGYFSRETCREEVVYEHVLVPVTERVFDRVVSRHFRLEITGSMLLNGESEEFTAGFDGFEDSLHVSSIYNAYRVTRAEHGRDVTYLLKGTRNLVAPANTLSVIMMNENGQAALKVIDAAFDADLGREMGTPVILVELMKRRKLWIDQKVASGEFELSSGSEVSLVQTGFRPQAGAEYYVKYSLKRMGSRFFSNGISRKTESSAAKF